MWSNNFSFHKSYASYLGGVDCNDFHHHAATQIIFGLQHPVHVLSESGETSVGQGFLIRPLVNHKVQCESDVVIVFIEPHSHLSFEISKCVGLNDIESLTDKFLAKIEFSKEHSQWMDRFRTLKKTDIQPLDARLSLALALLQSDLGSVSILAAAKQVGISGSRLRTLAREQLGVPISTWLIWRKLNRSTNELALGSNLTRAAMAGGFSDQAHFTRSMKRMFGITPKTATKALELNK